MSSDEGDPSAPVVQEDSDQGRSSVSSELQDEYEELLRYAVVTPRHDTHTTARVQQPSTSRPSAATRSSHRKDAPVLHHSADLRSDPNPRRSNKNNRTLPESFLTVEPVIHSRVPHAEDVTSRVSMSGALSDKLHRAHERARPDSQDPLEPTASEMFISSENLSKMENILDTWNNNLKSNVLMELKRWKLVFMEQHKQEMRKERESYTAQTDGLKSEIGSVKQLLHTYELSNRRKDEVIVNLSQVLDRQNEKLEKMRTFTLWRVQHAEAKEEAVAAQAARKHYSRQLKRKVWSGWHSLVQSHWKVKVEQACRAKAEEVCDRMSAEYEAKLAEHFAAIEKAQVEIQRLRLEREQYEESMKKAFMRGVCALNVEALHMFSSVEGRPEQAAQHEPLAHRDEPPSETLAQHQAYPLSAARLSPVHFDRQDAAFQSENNEMIGFAPPGSRAELLPPASTRHSSVPPGGATGFLKQQAGSRIVTASQQKPAKTVTARITARPDTAKGVRGNLQVMGVAPPMSSIIVERHHPVTQLTIGQATAAKFLRSPQQGPSSAGGRTSSRTHTIKVVD